MVKVNVDESEYLILLKIAKGGLYRVAHIAIWLDCSIAKAYQVAQKLEAKGLIGRSNGFFSLNEKVKQQLKDGDSDGDRDSRTGEERNAMGSTKAKEERGGKDGEERSEEKS